jgi:hypothetical protein
MGKTNQPGTTPRIRMPSQSWHRHQQQSKQSCTPTAMSHALNYTAEVNIAYMLQHQCGLLAAKKCCKNAATGQHNSHMYSEKCSTAATFTQLSAAWPNPHNNILLQKPQPHPYSKLISAPRAQDTQPRHTKPSSASISGLNIAIGLGL